MILVDANIPMYLIGADHPNKHRAATLVDAAVVGNERLITDADVLQEILHRYTAIDRPGAIQPAFDALLSPRLSLVDEMLPIDQADVVMAKEVVLGAYGLSARDALHVAVMRRRDVRGIMTFDTEFDRYPGIHRLS